MSNIWKAKADAIAKRCPNGYHKDGNGNCVDANGNYYQGNGMQQYGEDMKINPNDYEGEEREYLLRESKIYSNLKSKLGQMKLNRDSFKVKGIKRDDNEMGKYVIVCSNITDATYSKNSKKIDADIESVISELEKVSGFTVDSDFYDDTLVFTLTDDSFDASTKKSKNVKKSYDTEYFNNKLREYIRQFCYDKHLDYGYVEPNNGGWDIRIDPYDNMGMEQPIYDYLKHWFKFVEPTDNFNEYHCVDEMLSTEDWYMDKSTKKSKMKKSITDDLESYGGTIIVSRGGGDSGKEWDFLDYTMELEEDEDESALDDLYQKINSGKERFSLHRNNGWDYDITIVKSTKKSKMNKNTNIHKAGSFTFDLSNTPPEPVDNYTLLVRDFPVISPQGNRIDWAEPGDIQAEITYDMSYGALDYKLEPWDYLESRLDEDIPDSEFENLLNSCVATPTRFILPNTIKYPAKSEYEYLDSKDLKMTVEVKMSFSNGWEYETSLKVEAEFTPSDVLCAIMADTVNEDEYYASTKKSKMKKDFDPSLNTMYEVQHTDYDVPDYAITPNVGDIFINPNGVELKITNISLTSDGTPQIAYNNSSKGYEECYDLDRFRNILHAGYFAKKSTKKSYTPDYQDFRSMVKSIKTTGNHNKVFKE